MAAAAVETLEESRIRQHNFTKLARLLIREGTKVVQGFFDSLIPPRDLATKLSDPSDKVFRTLQDMRRRRILTQDEWNTLYPPSGEEVESKSFDITLLIKLLRSICGLSDPATGWDNLPNSTDTTLEADLARIKYYRNTLAHVNNMEIGDEDFKHYWEDIESALLRVFGQYESESRVEELKRKIDNYRTAPVTRTEMEEFLQYLRDISDQIERNQEEMTQKIERLRISSLHPELNLRLIIKTSVTGAWLFGSGCVLYRYRDDPENFLRMFKEFVFPSGVLVLAISRGSLQIHIQAITLSGLEELWKRYNTGQLKEDIEKVLITQELKQYTSQLGRVEIKVYISEEEYENARQQLLPVKKESPLPPAKTTKTSQSKTGKGSVSRKVAKSDKGKKETEKEKVLAKQETALQPKKVLEQPSTSSPKAISEDETVDIKVSQFIRLTRLLSLGIPIFRELFDSKFPPKDLASKLKEPHVYKILARLRWTKFSDTEWNILFPDPRAHYLVDSKEFSGDLLFKLLEEICDIDPPLYTGWNNLPQSADDKSLGAQLARFKWYRVGIYGHVNRYREFTDDTFHSYWTKVKDVLLAIVRFYDASKVEGYRIAIDNLPTSGYPDITVCCSFKLILALQGEKCMGISNYVYKSFISKPGNLMKLEEAFPNGILVRTVIHGSLKIVLWAIELNALEEFWRRYKKGKLIRDLRKTLVTEEIKKMTTGGEVKVSIDVDEQDYQDARENLLSYTAFEPHAFTKEESWEPEDEPEEYDTEEHKELRPQHPSQVREPLIDILHGEPLEDRTSIFQAHLAVITSGNQVRTVLRELSIQKKNVADATFVVWAYRISNQVKRFYAENSVGSYEYFAGKRVFNLLEQKDATNVVLIVTCWQGDVPALGMDTYDNISKCARELLHSFLESQKKMPSDSASKLSPR